MTKSGKNRLILAGVGVLLVLLGVRGVALPVVGASAQATVTDVRMSTSHEDDKMDHNYQIAYRFAVAGKNYTGTLVRKRVYNTLTLPNVGATVPIRYLSSAPAINGGANESILGGLVLGALGIGLLVFGFKPAKPAAREIAPADASPDRQS
jgi:hypothetical protein